MASLYNIKKIVVEGAKSIFSKGLVETGEGNVSTRLPKRYELFITPTFNRYETMTEDDIVQLNFDGRQISKGIQASKEYRLHVTIYKDRPKATCVIHTHSPYATMLSVRRIGIPVIMEEMVVLLGGSVKVSDFGLAHTEDVGEKALNALGGTNAILLANHGVLICGRTMKHSVKIAELVEKMAMIFWGTLQIGKPKKISMDACLPLKKEFKKNFSTI
jgi:L-fuculose-phosphate aldolase